jgi:phosphate starvation-inducible protein PhoH and related proteins
MTSEELHFSDNETAGILYGELNHNLHTLEKSAGVSIGVRGTSVIIEGSDHEVHLAAEVLRQLFEIVRTGYPVYEPDVSQAVQILERSAKADLKTIFLDKVYITADKTVISPKSINQKLYIDCIRNNDIVFGIGPAGTGKTYLAVAMAVSAFIKGKVKKIILARPAVEAGEKLGFLPGDLAQKVNPYLRPLHDALYDMLGQEKTLELIERELIEIAPIAFMRGRTLNNAFIILDEAQNTTDEQMKMFLTRLGFYSRAVITGDITQIDLESKQSGLLRAEKILKKLSGIGFCYFSEQDVVRHQLVRKIIKAYERK